MPYLAYKNRNRLENAFLEIFDFLNFFLKKFDFSLKKIFLTDFDPKISENRKKFLTHFWLKSTCGIKIRAQNRSNY